MVYQIGGLSVGANNDSAGSFQLLAGLGQVLGVALGTYDRADSGDVTALARSDLLGLGNGSGELLGGVGIGAVADNAVALQNSQGGIMSITQDTLAAQGQVNSSSPKSMQVFSLYSAVRGFSILSSGLRGILE